VLHYSDPERSPQKQDEQNGHARCDHPGSDEGALRLGLLLDQEARLQKPFLGAENWVFVLHLPCCPVHSKSWLLNLRLEQASR